MPSQFEGRLTARNCKRHIPHTFTVPAQTGQVNIHFRFVPHVVNEMKNMITLTLFDPMGWRGAGHRHGAVHTVTVSQGAATPGYLPGPVPAGEWMVQIDTHMIMPGEVVQYWLDISFAEAPAAATAQPIPQTLPQPSATSATRWYRGDLHSHTHHSDAGNRSVAELIQMARDYALDFIFLSDHNTIAGLAEMDAAASPTLLTAGGLELTTFWGHALVLGTRQWVDWRVRPGSGDIGHGDMGHGDMGHGDMGHGNMARIATAAYEAGQVYIIAHPMTIGDPLCTGCAWRYGDMMPGTARLVEIWNGVWDGYSNNEKALSLWYDWLNQGLRLAATAGSDSHDAAKYAAKPGFSVIYAQALTQAALLDGLRAGRLYLSSGPQLQFEATAPGQHWMIGDTVMQPATFTTRWVNAAPNSQLRVIANGRLLHQVAANEVGDFLWLMHPDAADWVVIELRDANGVMLAITNPIWLSN